MLQRESSDQPCFDLMPAYQKTVVLLVLCVSCSPANQPRDEKHTTVPIQTNVTELMTNNEGKAENPKFVTQLHQSERLTASVAEFIQDGQPSSRLAVIIEIKTPRPQVRFEPREQEGTTALRPTSVSVNTELTNTDEFDEASKYFKARSWTGHSPVFIKAASTVSLDVSPSELEEILTQPFVRKVSRNQHYRPKK